MFKSVDGYWFTVWVISSLIVWGLNEQLFTQLSHSVLTAFCVGGWYGGRFTTTRR